MRQQYRDRDMWSCHITKVVTLARIRELHIGMEYGTEARRQHIETVPRTSFQLPYIV